MKTFKQLQAVLVKYADHLRKKNLLKLKDSEWDSLKNNSDVVLKDKLKNNDAAWQDWIGAALREIAIQHLADSNMPYARDFRQNKLWKVRETGQFTSFSSEENFLKTQAQLYEFGTGVEVAALAEALGIDIWTQKNDEPLIQSNYVSTTIQFDLSLINEPLTEENTQHKKTGYYVYKEDNNWKLVFINQAKLSHVGLIQADPKNNETFNDRINAQIRAVESIDAEGKMIFRSNHPLLIKKDLLSLSNTLKQQPLSDAEKNIKINEISTKIAQAQFYPKLTNILKNTLNEINNTSYAEQKNTLINTFQSKILKLDDLENEAQLDLRIKDLEPEKTDLIKENIDLFEKQNSPSKENDKRPYLILHNRSNTHWRLLWNTLSHGGYGCPDNKGRGNCLFYATAQGLLNLCLRDLECAVIAKDSINIQTQHSQKHSPQPQKKQTTFLQQSPAEIQKLQSLYHKKMRQQKRFIYTLIATLLISGTVTALGILGIASILIAGITAGFPVIFSLYQMVKYFQKSTEIAKEIDNFLLKSENSAATITKQLKGKSVAPLVNERKIDLDNQPNSSSSDSASDGSSNPKEANPASLSGSENEVEIACNSSCSI